MRGSGTGTVPSARPGPLHSLRARLLALVLSLVAAVWALAATLAWTDVHHELDELLDARLAQRQRAGLVHRAAHCGGAGGRRDSGAVEGARGVEARVAWRTDVTPG